MIIQTNGQIDVHGFSVEEVLNKAEILFNREGTDAFTFKKAVAHWDLYLESERAMKVIAELLRRRFLTSTGEGSDRAYQLTDLAVRFVGDDWSVRHTDMSRGNLSGMWKEMAPYL